MQLIKNVGVEIEFAKTLRETVNKWVRNNIRGWNVVHDGSCSQREHTYRDSYGEAIIPHGPITYEGVVETIRGGELTSPVLDTTTQNWFDTVGIALDYLARVEEGEAEPNTSIHVHVNVGGSDIPLIYIFNFLRIIEYSEAMLFRLSCGEVGTHRGRTNNYKYCRPNSTPPYVYTIEEVDKVCPVFSTKLLYKAKNLQEIRKGLGRLDRAGTTKWVPARYVAVNLVSLFQLGSLELRTFNVSFNHSFVQAWIELSRHLVELCFNDLTIEFEDLPKHPVGNDDLKLDEFIQTLFIPDRLGYTLEELYQLGTPIQAPPPMLTHVSANSVDWTGARRFRPPVSPLSVLTTEDELPEIGIGQDEEAFLEEEEVEINEETYQEAATMVADIISAGTAPTRSYPRYPRLTRDSGFTLRVDGNNGSEDETRNLYTTPGDMSYDEEEF